MSNELQKPPGAVALAVVLHAVVFLGPACGDDSSSGGPGGGGGCPVAQPPQGDDIEVGSVTIDVPGGVLLEYHDGNGALRGVVMTDSSGTTTIDDFPAGGSATVSGLNTDARAENLRTIAGVRVGQRVSFAAFDGFAPPPAPTQVMGTATVTLPPPLAGGGVSLRFHSASRSFAADAGTFPLRLTAAELSESGAFDALVYALGTDGRATSYAVRTDVPTSGAPPNRTAELVIAADAFRQDLATVGRSLAGPPPNDPTGVGSASARLELRRNGKMFQNALPLLEPVGPVRVPPNFFDSVRFEASFNAVQGGGQRNNSTRIEVVAPLDLSPEQSDVIDYELDTDLLRRINASYSPSGNRVTWTPPSGGAACDDIDLVSISLAASNDEQAGPGEYSFRWRVLAPATDANSFVLPALDDCNTVWPNETFVAHRASVELVADSERSFADFTAVDVGDEIPSAYVTCTTRASEFFPEAIGDSLR